MIIEFSLGNYRSFKEVETIQLQAAKIKSKYPSVDENNIFQANDKHQLLKSKIVYGANASGKSNLVKGLLAMLRIIKYSFKDEETIEVLVEPFRLSKETVNQPTFFQICFILNKISYRYGMQLQGGEITAEWLFGTPKKKEVYFFIREGMTVKVNEKQFKEATRLIPKDKNETPLYGASSLFLTVAAASKRKLAEEISNYFTNQIGILSGLKDSTIMNYALDALDNKVFKSKLIKLLNAIGMDLSSIDKEEIDLDDLPEEIRNSLSAKKQKFAFIELTKKVFEPDGSSSSFAKFELNNDEAEGTKKIISLAPFLFSALTKGKLIVIDEFDARLHPRLSRKIVELFNSNETNPNNAQLIVISHDTNLMDAQLFRRDQISFTEKNKYGASKIYSLIEYKGIRNNSSFEKDYLKGKYGAVPFLNSVDNLFINESPIDNA